MKKKMSPWPVAVAVFLAAVFTVNLIMLTVAIKSDDGVTDENYYEKGLFYDSQRATDKELGWEIALDFKSVPRPGSLNDIEIRIRDRNGAPVADAVVKAVLKRPATNRFDYSFACLQRGASYRGSVEIPSGGYWDLEIMAFRGEKAIERVFRVKVDA